MRPETGTLPPNYPVKRSPWVNKKLGCFTGETFKSEIGLAISGDPPAYRTLGALESFGDS